MAHEEEIELLEESWEVKRSSLPRGRLVALVLGVVACVSLVGLNMPRQTRRSMKDHLRMSRKALLSAFNRRSLQEATEEHTESISILIAAEGAEVPDAMTITATVDEDPDPQDTMTIDFVFNALEGKGDMLKDKFQKAWDTAVEDDEMKKMMTISSDGDKVTLSLEPPHEAAGVVTGQLDGEMPTLTGTMKFGTTLQELYEKADHDGDDAQEGVVPMLVEGMSAKIEAAFAVAAVKAVESVEEDMGRHPGAEVDFLSSLSKINFNSEIRYKNATKFKAAMLSDLPRELTSLKYMKGMIKGAWSQAPDNIRESMMGMEEFADGLDSVQVHGLPDKLRLIIQTSGVHLTPIITDLFKKE